MNAYHLGLSSPVPILLLLFFVLTCPSNSQAQEMYKALMGEHGSYRSGVGVQAGDPAGISVQLYRGFFCSSENAYATYGVWEFVAGFENLIGLSHASEFEGKPWGRGGFRFEASYLQPLWTKGFGPSTLQIYGGMGLQTGTRNQDGPDGERRNATGANLIGRLEYSPPGFEAGRSMLFVAVHADWKYHRELSHDFQYSGPAIGIRVRKVR